MKLSIIQFPKRQELMLFAFLCKSMDSAKVIYLKLEAKV